MMATLTLPMWLRDVTELQTVASAPAWLSAAKKQSWDAFIQADIPTRKNESFKYTDFSFLANKRFFLSTSKDVSGLSSLIASSRTQQADDILLVVVNGVFQPSLSDMSKLPNSILVTSVAEAMANTPELLKSSLQAKSPCYFAELNHALFTDGLFIHLPESCQVNQLIHVLSIVTEQSDCLLVPRHVYALGKNTRLHLLEEYRSLHQSAYFHNVVTHWQLSEGASVRCYKKQFESLRAAHIAHTFVDQCQDSQFDLVNVTTGGVFSRDDVVVHLKETRANCSLSGFYTLRQHAQYIDHHIEINHDAAHGQSEMLYKGILDDASRAVFNGRLHVKKDAQHIKAYQANHHLLLSRDAEAYSKPELEIYADDVKCKHGATTGQLDEEALFYLRSRGINKKQAMAILMQGFAEEVLMRINNTSLLAHMQEGL